MSSFNKRESAEFALAADTEAEKLLDGVDKVLADGAARGFPAPPGETLEAILMAGQDTKGKLAEVDGKIYDTRRGVLFDQQQFALKVFVQLAKLALDLYRERLFNAFTIEEAQWSSTKEKSLADVARLNAETERRQVAIIQSRAEAERRIIVYKQQLVAEATTTLTAEQILVAAQLATAEKKLEIIASIYQVLAAEQLVVAAEQRRAASLNKVLAAELIVAGIKKEMVPYYIEKAEAREALAQAITAEIPVTEALIRLGYDRIDLKTTEEYAGHLERDAQEDLELAKEELIRATTATELLKLQNRRLLLEYRNNIQSLIQQQKKSLKEDEIAFSLTTGLQRTAIDIDNAVTLTRHEITNLTTELVAILSNMTLQAQDHAATEQDGALLVQGYNELNADIQRKILSG